jgi:RNA polymerase sigma-70 factor (ECF subfamily)
MGTTAPVAQVARWVQDGPLADRESRAHAFRLHVEPEIEVLLRVARTLTRSGPDAEDLVQETLVRAYRAIDRFDGRHPRAWLLTILRNTDANMHRRRRPGLVDDWVVMDDQRPAFGVAPAAAEDEALWGRLEADLQRAVQQLDPRFQRVLLLIDVDQLTYAEAARALGVPVGTVMSRLHRARERVRRALSDPPTEGGAS